ncbi:hypothetical protein, partial [Mycolicibacterium austroafricanum]|uniref:hypothetical protein n=1 Tax=Mycolicibacterium austroafricanum TaxID=39687 RepID=UPI000D417D9D
TSGVTGARPARLPIELSSAGPMSSTVADLRILAELTLGPADGATERLYGGGEHRFDRFVDRACTGDTGGREHRAHRSGDPR